MPANNNFNNPILERRVDEIRETIVNSINSSSDRGDSTRPIDVRTDNYDSSGRLDNTEIRRADTGSIQSIFSYSPSENGQVELISRVRYDEQGNPTEITHRVYDDDIHSSIVAYEKFGEDGVPKMDRIEYSQDRILDHIERFGDDGKIEHIDYYRCTSEGAVQEIERQNPQGQVESITTYSSYGVEIEEIEKVYYDSRIEYTYHEDGSVASITNSNGFLSDVVTTYYDNDGDIERVDSGNGDGVYHREDYHRIDESTVEISRTDYPDGSPSPHSVRVEHRDENGRVDWIETRNPEGTHITRDDYQRDSDGNVTSIEHSKIKDNYLFPGQTLGKVESAEHYDREGQVIARTDYVYDEKGELSYAFEIRNGIERNGIETTTAYQNGELQYTIIETRNYAGIEKREKFDKDGHLEYRLSEYHVAIVDWRPDDQYPTKIEHFNSDGVITSVEKVDYTHYGRDIVSTVKSFETDTTEVRHYRGGMFHDYAPERESAHLIEKYDKDGNYIGKEVREINEFSREVISVTIYDADDNVISVEKPERVESVMEGVMEVLSGSAVSNEDNDLADTGTKLESICEAVGASMGALLESDDVETESSDTEVQEGQVEREEILIEVEPDTEDSDTSTRD